MACCGQKRAALKQQRDYDTTDENQQNGLHHTHTLEKDAVLFEHTGTSSLMIKGAITHKTYAFRGKGDTLTIDIRDVPSMFAEPYLQRVTT